MTFFSKKNFTIVERTFINKKLIYLVKEKFSIKCLGGGNMENENDVLVFVETDSIPKALKGKTGRNWTELFNTIPDGKSAIIPEDFGTGATVRQAVKNINSTLGKKTYQVTQRTENEKTVVYVSKV